jgi:hypothetical protein
MTKSPTLFIRPCPDRDRHYRIGSNFWKFYLIRTGFTLGEPVSLVKVFRLFKLEQMFFWCSECGHSRQMYNILFIGRASMFVMPCFLRVDRIIFLFPINY